MYDQTLYGGSASYYTTGRLPYPAAVAETIERQLTLDGTQRVLDVGCGPGSLTLLLAPMVAAAIGVDADRAMLEAAARGGDRVAAANVSWRHLRAEELPADLGRFDLVTFAQSFHWMDRLSVATATRRMLTPGGTCLLVQATTHRGDASDDPLPHPRPPHEAIAALIRSYLGPVRRAGRGSRAKGLAAGEDEILSEAGFDGPSRVEVGHGRGGHPSR